MSRKTSKIINKCHVAASSSMAEFKARNSAVGDQLDDVKHWRSYAQVVEKRTCSGTAAPPDQTNSIELKGAVPRSHNIANRGGDAERVGSTSRGGAIICLAILCWAPSLVSFLHQGS